MHLIPTPDGGSQVYYVETERTEPNGDVIRETHQRYVIGWPADDFRSPLVIQPDGRLTSAADWLATFNRRDVACHGIRPRYSTDKNPWSYAETAVTLAPKPEPVGVAAELDGSAFYRD